MQEKQEVPTVAGCVQPGYLEKNPGQIPLTASFLAFHTGGNWRGRKEELPSVSPLPHILHNSSYQKYSMYVKLFLRVVGTMLSTLSALTHLILTTTH